MGDEYPVLYQTAARVDLTSHGRIRVTGEDRARLLHAMCTNDVQSLVAGTGCYAFFLNAVGRVLADADILCFDDHFLLDTEPESRAFLMEHLDKFIIADDVVLEDVTSATFASASKAPKPRPRCSSPGCPCRMRHWLTQPKAP
jgi:folate-binding Fe-S cluster repair protein YgfZ